MSESAQPAQSLAGFYRRKWFSFFGLVPMAIYVFVHLAAHAVSHRGARAWEERLEAWHDNPYYWPVIILFVYLPFAVHALVGLALTFTGRPNLGRMPTFTNVKYVLQRVSALGVLLFLGAHIYKTRIEHALSGEPLAFEHMVEGFHHAPTIAVYVLGILGVAFHLANGFWLGGITWGITVSRRSQRAWQAASIVIFVVIAAMGFAAMWGFGKVPFSPHGGHATLPN
jgi:succinate dehydrogenase / fumarate reductase cytochrome b subunit